MLGSLRDDYRAAALASWFTATMSGEEIEPERILGSFIPDSEHATRTESDEERDLRQLNEASAFL